MQIFAGLKLSRYTEFHQLSRIHMHLDLHPSAGNVAIHTGRLSLATGDFHDTGTFEELTTCTVWTESPLTEGPVDALALTCLLFPDSPAQVCVLCTAAGGAAEYFLFDAAEPRVRILLNGARNSGKLFFTSHHAGEVTDAPMEGQLFENMPRLQPAKQTAQRSEWVLNVARVAQTLPHFFSFAAPQLAQVTDHRAYLMLAA